MSIIEQLKAAIDEAEQLARAAANPADNAPRHAVDQFATDDELAFDAHFTPQLLEPFLAAHREILELHAPREARWPEGVLQCEHCADLCHSGSGIACEQPDAPYPCPTVKALAKGYGIEADQ